MSDAYDAVLLVSFGGPERPEDVLPFLENVVRGRNVPRERLVTVAEHYHHLGGKSPINDQNRALIAALRAELDARGPRLPIYWGNRNWHPMLTDTLAEMKADGIRRALAFVTSAFSSYSGCRQYREDIARAQEAVGPGAPHVDKLRVYFNHPGFIEPMVVRVREALSRFSEADRPAVPIAFTAHSIPRSMAEGSRYEEQLREACRLVAAGAGAEDRWELVWQSRSGPPQIPWLEPDIGDHLRALADAGTAKGVVVAPIGFISDHVEVVWDLDHEAQEIADEVGLTMRRAATVGIDPAFVAMIRELIVERLPESQRRDLGLPTEVERRAVGRLGPNHDVCPPDCCKYEPRRPRPAAG
jgi:ferrochelatase